MGVAGFASSLPTSSLLPSLSLLSSKPSVPPFLYPTYHNWDIYLQITCVNACYQPLRLILSYPLWLPQNFLAIRLVKYGDQSGSMSGTSRAKGRCCFAKIARTCIVRTIFTTPLTLNPYIRKSIKKSHIEVKVPLYSDQLAPAPSDLPLPACST